MTLALVFSMKRESLNARLVYGMTSGKTVPPAEVGFPIIVFLRNFARMEGQQGHKDWQKKKLRKNELNKKRNSTPQMTLVLVCTTLLGL